MWNLAFLFLFILHADGKSSNLCRLNPPRCDGDKIIKIDMIRCIKAAKDEMWSTNKMLIEQKCNHAKYCDIKNLMTVVEFCCGDKKYQQENRSKLRFSYQCIQERLITKATPPKMLPTTPSSPAANAGTTKQMSGLRDIDNFCVINLCAQSPYCSAGTEIAIMNISDSSHADEVMNSLTYYCNKRQRCSEGYEAYMDNKCKSEDNIKLHYVCMKEKVTTTVMCDFEEIIDNLEGQIRSSSYPNMIPAGTSSCQIKILFQEISILELFLLDLPAVDVVYENEYREWSSTQKVTTRHQLISPAHQVLLSVDFDKLPQRRIWMYYRVFPAVTYHANIQIDLPWTNTCPSHMTTSETVQVTTSKNIPSSSEAPKTTTFKLRSSVSPSKDMHSMHKTEVNQGIDELSTAPHIVIPDGIPVDTDVVDKMEPVTFPVGPSTSSSSASSSSEGDVNPVEKPTNPTNHENREKASSSSDTPTTGLYSREVVIGLIAGVVILACLVIILLTALFASMRRNPPNTIACGTTKPPPPSNAAQL